MGEEMGDHLRQALRSFCYKTQWKYAVFWKLKRRASLVLAWEDAYYNDHEPSDSNNTMGNLNSARVPNNLHRSQHIGDPLGLAVAKMSYRVYSLGEGIIGHVAFEGKHRWIFADETAYTSWLIKEPLDGWQTQFSAGIKTVAVVAVVPYGVVQLGSLDLVLEDLELVTHIKDVFNLLQCSTAFLPDPPSIINIFPEDKNILHESKVSNGCLHGSDQELSEPRPNFQTPLLAYSEVGKEVLPEYFHSQKSGLQNSSCFTELSSGAYCNTKPSSNVHLESMNMNVARQLADACALDHSLWSHAFEFSNWCIIDPDHGVCHHDIGQLPQSLGMPPSNYSKTLLNPPLRFSSGCELHEAIESCFKEKQDNCPHSEDGCAEIGVHAEAPDGVLSTLFSGSDGSDHLLEAVVAGAYAGIGKTKDENSSCKSVSSRWTTESAACTAKHNKHGTDGVQSCTTYQHSSSIEDSSELLTVGSLNEKSLKTLEMCSTLSNSYTGPAKVSKKRSKPGEGCRPRPRDRQLIQDRIKELRDIVPNGSKCSIDMLLERTVKHVVFLQSVTSHADQLKHYTKSKCEKTSHLQGTCSQEHGASWAVELGLHNNACPIIVENQDINGKMLVEMLCEECSLFFKIAEAIRGLGFAILKGITESRAGKTWASFVVEGHGNGSQQRMDILWSLMQLLQPETRR